LHLNHSLAAVDRVVVDDILDSRRLSPSAPRTCARLRRSESWRSEINRKLAIVRRAFRLAVKADRYYGRVSSFPMLAENNVRTGSSTCGGRERHQQVGIVAATRRPVRP
jgi:hypothetical protein